MAENIRSKLLGGVHHRELHFDRASVRADERTIEVAFCSEDPYERWWGIEILDCSPQSVRMERLKNGAAVLLNHDARDHIGVVEGARMAADRRGRATLRFGRGELAAEVLRDVEDGIRTKVSVGYRIHDLVLERQEGGISTYRVTDWEPFEISIVSIPADDTVGVGRGIQKEDHMTDRNYMPRGQRRAEVREERELLRRERELLFAAAPPEDRDAFRQHVEALDAERGERIEGREATVYADFRVAEIAQLADMWPEHRDIQALAETVKGDPKFTVAAFRKGMLKMITDRRGTPTSTGQLEADNPGYLSGAREVFGHQRLRNFTGPNAERNAHRFGMWVLSQMPGRDDAKRWCADNGLALQRNINSTVGSEGGFLVPDELSSELIRNFDTHGVARREARNWPMNSQSLMVPTRETGLTASFVAEGTEASDSDPGFGQVVLSTKSVRCVSIINRETMEDSIIGMADFVAGEISEAFALLEDSCLFIGDGTSTYGGMTGVRNALAAGSRVDAASGHDLVGEIDVTDLSNLMAALPMYAQKGAKWFCSMAIYSAVLQRLLLTAGGNTISILERGASTNPSFAGHDVVLTPVLPSGIGSTNYNATDMLYFGNMQRAAAFGDRRVVSMLIDPYSLAAKGQIRLVGFERFDCVVHGTGTASAPGPILALRGKT